MTKKRIAILLSGVAITCLLSVGIMYQTGVLPLQTNGSTVNFESSAIAIGGQRIRVTTVRDGKVTISDTGGKGYTVYLVAGTYDLDCPNSGAAIVAIEGEAAISVVVK